MTQFKYSSLSDDKENPIFHDKNDADTFGISSVMVFPGAIGFLGKWTPYLAVTWADANSDIDFNDTSIWIVSAALSRKF